MKIFKNEIYKIFGNKIFCAVLFGLLLLNSIFIYQKIYMGNDISKYSPTSYNALYANIKDMDSNSAYDKVTSLYTQMEIYSSLRFLNQNEFSFTIEDIQKMYPKYDIISMVNSYTNGVYLKYTDSIEKELSLYSDVIDELKNCVDYQSYLQKIDDSATSLSTISIFANNSYNNKNILKIVKDFSSLKGHKLSIDPSKGVELATEFQPTDIIGLFLIVIMVAIIIMMEKENSLNVLIKTYYHGHFALAISKLSSIIFGCIVVVSLLYGSNYFIAYKVYGFGSLNRYIQSVYGFMGSSLSITVFQYLLLFLLAKVMVYILAATILYLLANISNNALYMYTGTSVFVGIEFLLYTGIDSAGTFAFFKYCNIFYFINTYTLFSKYININLFGYPINYITIFIIVHSILVLLCAIIGSVVFSKQEVNRLSNNRAWKITDKLTACSIFKTHKTTNLFRHEYYKIFFSGKALLVLIIFAIIMFFTYTPIREQSVATDANYYKEYTLKYEGALDDEKKVNLLQEKAYYEEDAKKIIDSYIDLSESNRENLQNIVDRQNAIYLVIQQMNYIEKQGNGWIVYDSGYNLLTGGNRSGHTDLQQALLAMFVVICCLTWVYSMEYSSGMNYLLQTTYKGRYCTFVSKFVLSIIIINIIYGIIYGTYFYDILSTFGTSAITAPANSLQHLSIIPDRITILQYLIFISVTRYIGMVLSVLMIFFISSRMKSFTKTMLVSIGLFLLPIFFSLIGLNWFDYILLNPLLKGNFLN